jgi:arginase family enzyme
MRGLEGINLIAADIVEVAPAYDTNAELTTMAAAVSCTWKPMRESILMMARTSCMKS